MKPIKEEHSIVVVGAMNPRLHHPYWYRFCELLTDAESEAATKAPETLVSQPLSQFVAPGFRIVCQLERWEIITDQPENSDLILRVASTVFEKLDHTPISVFGFNFRFHCLTSRQSPGEHLGRLVKSLPIGLSEAGTCRASISLVTGPLERRITIQVEQSLLNPSALFIAHNANYPVVSSEKFAHFALTPLLVEHYAADRVEALRRTDEIVESING